MPSTALRSVTALLIRLSLDRNAWTEVTLLALPTSATCKTDNEINHVNPSCVPLSPAVARSVFPGARAGCVRTAFVPQLGAIGPVSPLRAGHSCGETGQLNSVGFHEEAEGRETGLGGTQTAGVG